MKRFHRMHPALRSAALWLLMLWLLGVTLIHAQPAAPTACQDLLTNGDFEAGPAGWTQSSAGGYQLISRFNPRSGQWGAYLAGANDADDRLSQALLLPSNAVSITLRLWWSVESEEPPVPADTLTASLFRPDGSLLAELWTIDNTATTGIWDELVADLTPWAGQQATLQFRARTDHLDLTDFYLDDMGVRACAASPTPTASPTSTASPTPTASLTPTASPTPTGPPRRTLFPLIIRQR
jgi:hypothetical protein